MVMRTVMRIACVATPKVHHADLDFQKAKGLLDFEDEMRSQNVSYWSTHKYGNCVHGWTDPTSQNYRPASFAMSV